MKLPFNNEPRYCSYCGQALIKLKVNYYTQPRYDIYTGQKNGPDSYDTLSCPRYDYKKDRFHDFWFATKEGWLRSI